jgi:hypothetical protein
LLLIASQISFAHRKTIIEPIIREVEKIVEVEKPVDRIVVEYKTIEIEKIVEVPVEKEVIKTITVEVEKIVEVFKEQPIENVQKSEPKTPRKKKIIPEVSKVDEVVESPITLEAAGYVQNEEQTSKDTLWKNIQRKRLLKPMDVLYSEYDKNQFQDIDFSNQDQSDPVIQTLIKYVEGIKEKRVKFEDILPEHAEKLVDLIHRE